MEMEAPFDGLLSHPAGEFSFQTWLQRITNGGSRGGARGARPPPLFLDETEAQGAEKSFLEDPHPFI